MSKQDSKRIEVLTEVLAGQRTTVSAASFLNISVRQTQRLLKRYQDGGGAALIQKARGRTASNQINVGVRDYALVNVGVRDYALELVRQNYRDFGPTLAAEALRERHGLEVSRETLRKWMVEFGLWLSRKQRRSFHQPRLRRQHHGELIQIDGSDHRWFEGRAAPCTLLVFIDDATSKLMQLRFVASETTENYFEAPRGYLQAHRHHVRELQPSQGARRARQPDAAGSAGEGTKAGRDQRRRFWKCVSSLFR
jgi:hypothetical protein